jgi:esterase/lipase superfamily enzyme
MQLTCRWIGMTAVMFLLAVVVGCGGSHAPQRAKPGTPVNPEATAPTKLPDIKSTAPKATETLPKATAAPPAKKTVAKKAAPLPEKSLADQKLLLRESTPEETGAAEENPAADKDLPYSVVKVYYATDRERLDAGKWQKVLRGGWPTLTGVLAAITVVLWLARRRVPRLIRGLTWLCLVATLVLGGLTLAYRYLPALAKLDIDCVYGGGRGDFELGTCEVSIPKDHRMGQLESPTLLRLELRPDPERHIVLLGVHSETPEEFYADLHSCINKSTRKEAFVFVHGYNVGFDTAVRRTAQISYDLKFDGAAIAYSWPSEEGLLSYTVDETNVAWTVPHLKEFLNQVVKQSGAESVHLIAHSMGNRALTQALREIELEQKVDRPKFQEVVLTAPDVDADVFRRDLAPAIVKIADHVTLYASSNDKALIASREIHGYLRAGESGKAMVVVPGIDTVDVSEVDTSLIGHSYYGSSTTVLADLFELMQSSKPPDQRKWLRSMKLGALKYWKFLKKKVREVSAGKEL